MFMKRTLLLLMLAAGCMTAGAAAPKRPMLVQGKTWTYIYHHITESETLRPDDPYKGHKLITMWYTLRGDTVIDGRQYMKMYRSDEIRVKETYYAAYREDEEGRVYMAEYRGEKDFKIIDFTEPVMKEESNGDWPYGYPGSAIRETIKANGKLFTRYRYTDSDAVGVEGVGYQRSGLTTFAFEPVPTCICDYDELYSVSCNDFYFTASDFDAPKEIELAEGERKLIESNNDFAFNDRKQ